MKKNKYKNTLPAVLAFLFFVLFLPKEISALSYEKKEEFSFVVNNEKTTIPRDQIQPFFHEGRVMIPAYMLENIFEYNVVWGDDFSSITVTNSEKTVSMKKNDKMAIVNGKSEPYFQIEDNKVDLYPVMKYERLFVPARFIIEKMGGEIIYKFSLENDTRLHTLHITIANESNKISSISDNIEVDSGESLSIFIRAIRSVSEFFNNILAQLVQFFNER